MRRRHNWKFKKGYGLYYAEKCVVCGAERLVGQGFTTPATDPETRKRKPWCDEKEELHIRIMGSPAPRVDG